MLSRLLILLLLFASCKTEKRYQTESGLKYIIYSSSKDSIARMGQTVKIRFTQKVRDSIISTTENKMPLYYMVMPGYGNRYNPLEVLDYGLRKGDSVVTTQLVDSMLKKGIFKTMPRWMKKTDEWYTYFKVVDVFTNDSLLQADKQKEATNVIAIQTSLGRQRIEDWLKAHNIGAMEAENGVFAENIREGIGTVADTATLIKAILNVRTLKDSVLNNNDTVSFKPNQHFFPSSIDKHAVVLKTGEIIRIYLPAVLTAGAEPASPKIKADDDIVFEVRRIQ